mmetsp:Transcript_70272/g.131418  ORF Transcript_70272/g.131418 Transcript_70272/m.131418 type:complete len:288 (-) Transcript_70272:228-1091(-)
MRKQRRLKAHPVPTLKECLHMDSATLSKRYTMTKSKVLRAHSLPRLLSSSSSSCSFASLFFARRRVVIEDAPPRAPRQRMLGGRATPSSGCSSSGSPTASLHDHGTASLSSRLPTTTLHPKVRVSNLRSSLVLAKVPGTSTTSHLTSVGHKAAAARCRQYRRRLSKLNHLTSWLYNSRPVLGSSLGAPSASRSLQRHFVTSMHGNGPRSRTMRRASACSLGSVPSCVASSGLLLALAKASHFSPCTAASPTWTASPTASPTGSDRLPCGSQSTPVISAKVSLIMRPS